MVPKCLKKVDVIAKGCEPDQESLRSPSPDVR